MSKAKDTQPSRADQIAELTKRLKRAGAVDAKQWASSEVREGIPQFARFLLLKHLTLATHDVSENLALAEDMAPAFAEAHAAASQTLGAKALEALLRDYGKGLVQQFIGLIDDGNEDSEEDEISWVLVQTDGDGQVCEPLRIIEGLQEDLLDFEETSLAKRP